MPTMAEDLNSKVQQPRIALLGCGYWGKHLLRNFDALGCLAAISDVDRERATAYAAEYGVPAVSLSELLSDESISGIAIATPAEQHSVHAREALLAGKHVFVEKPLALDIPAAEALCTLAEKQARVLMVGHLLRYHPAFLSLKQIVSDGMLGRLQYIYSNRLNLGKVRREENILWSFAPHDISMILALVGAEPATVSATGSCYLHKTIADVTTTHLSFPGGENAHVFVSWLHPFKEQKLVVVGDRGMAVFDDREPWESKLMVYPHRIDWKNGMPVPNKADGQPIGVPESEPLRDECLHFLECIGGEQKCRTDGPEGVRVLRVLQAAERSMRTRTAPK